MYCSWFELQQPLFLAGSHASTHIFRYDGYCAFLSSALQRNGTIWLYGVRGSGKSTLLNCCLKAVPDSLFLVASSTLTPQKSVQILSEEILDVGELAAYLLARTPYQRRVLLIIDNAEQLSAHMRQWLLELMAAIEQRQGVLSLLLASVTARAPWPEKLDFRIHTHLHLPPLNKQECSELLERAAEASGASRRLFTPRAMRALWRASNGLPTQLMLLAESAIYSAMLSQKKQVSLQHCQHAKFDLRQISPFISLRRMVLIIILTISSIMGWHVAPNIIDKFPILKLWESPKNTTVSDKTAEFRASMDNEMNGMKQYYSIWGYQAGSDESSCEEAGRVGLSCIRGTASLDTLSETNVPWLTSLTVEARTGYASVVRIGPNDLDLLSGRKTWTVTREWFTQHWNGNYIQFQPISPSGANKVSIQSPANDKVWLQKMLVSALNLNADVNSTGALTSNIRAFQQLSGLEIDEVAGKKTILKLAQNLGKAPQLIIESDRKNP